MQQGTFNIEVIAKDSYSATTGDSTIASYTAQSRVVGNTAVISAMSNPLVALYSAPPSAGSSMYVQFAQIGPNPSWQDTSPQPVVPGESTNFIVAGMLPDTTYLMRDVLSDGTASAPLAFTTGSLPSYVTFPTFTVPGPPAPGTDLSQNMILHMGVWSTAAQVDTVATDLNGNIDWYFDQVANNFPSYAVNMVPGGTVLLQGGTVLGGADATGLREVDLAGDLVRQTNVNAVNAELTAMGVNNITYFTHDAVRLPNGDTAVLALDQKVIDVNGTPTTYLGDEVLVLDKNFQVSWAWDAFDWLSTSRLPTLGEGPGDWLHANSVNWSPEDDDLIVSLRAQDWVLKIDYDNGSGDGHIVWTLGADGSFTVIAPPGTQSPWFSHQHDATYINDTTIILFDDGNGRAATNPDAYSRGQEWVLNEQNMTATLVVNADLGNYSAALGSAQMLPNGNLDFNSGFLGTAPDNFGDSIEILPDGTITYVQTMSPGLEYRSYFMSTLYGTAANILDPGFEYPMLGSGESAYQYDPTASTWSFSGSAGLAGNGSAFTSGNPNAPQAEQVAFIQNSGVIGQAVDFAEAGTYQLSVSAAQRGNHSNGSDEEVDVLVDGTVVGSITPAGTSYATYTTGSFSVTAGSHIIKFVGIDPSGADYTALLDQVNINNVAPTGFSDPGFESPSQGSGESAYQYDPAGSAWSFSGDAGLSGNGSGFTAGNPNAPEGSQVAFVQMTGTASQVVVFPTAAAGSYQITLSAAQRGNHSGGSNEEIEVKVDGTVVGTFTPSSTSYANYTTASFSVTAGSHTISFVGVDPSGADYTAFLDQASINIVSPTAFSDPGFETPSQGMGASAYTYGPTGSSWTFSSLSGLSGNGSAITSGNPNAPQGSQVAFIQNTGTISQVVNFATAGSYQISVSAAQRGNYQGGSNEEIEVEVDGTLMTGTFTPGSTSYATYTSVPFNVTAGDHTITFVGVDPSGADYTALLDQATINNVSPPGIFRPQF